MAEFKGLFVLKLDDEEEEADDDPSSTSSSDLDPTNECLWYKRRRK